MIIIRSCWTLMSVYYAAVLHREGHNEMMSGVCPSVYLSRASA